MAMPIYAKVFMIVVLGIVNENLKNLINQTQKSYPTKKMAPAQSVGMLIFLRRKTGCLNVEKSGNKYTIRATIYAIIMKKYRAKFHYFNIC